MQKSWSIELQLFVCFDFAHQHFAILQDKNDNSKGAIFMETNLFICNICNPAKTLPNVVFCLITTFFAFAGKRFVHMSVLRATSTQLQSIFKSKCICLRLCKCQNLRAESYNQNQNCTKNRQSCPLLSTCQQQNFGENKHFVWQIVDNLLQNCG